MLISQQDLLRLKNYASSCKAEEFCNLAKALLLTDFDAVLAHLRTQKLLVKPRSVDTTRKISDLLEEWSISAPISGKRKSSLKRHLEISVRVQELFSEIDAASKKLQIWRCNKAQIALCIMEAVEQCYDFCVSEGRERKLGGLDIWETLDSTRALSTNLRDFCDSGLVLLSEAASRCPEDGPVLENLEELTRGFELAGTYDRLSVVFDHYSFTRWRVSITDSDIRFHPALDDYDRARHWCAQRTEASAPHFRDMVTIEFARIEADARKTLAAPPDNNFETFLLSPLCATVRKTLRSLREKMVRFMNGRVSSVFDLTATMNIGSTSFVVGDLLLAWSAIWMLALCGRIWNSLRVIDGEFKGGDTGRVPVLSFECLDNFFVSELGISETSAANFRLQFTAELGNRPSLDLFYRPFLRLSAQECALALSYAETSRFDRNLFRIALRDSDMDVSKRGFKPLTKLVETLKGKGFSALSNVPVLFGGEIRTDADLVFYAEELLFIAQAKIVIEADSLYETWQVEQKLRDAGAQLNRTLNLIKEPENMDSIANRLGLLSNSVGHIVPFILTNDWHFTGVRIRGYPVIDLSYLDLILNSGSMLLGTSERPLRLKFIRGDVPTADELRSLIEEPIHRTMFTRPKIDFMKQPVGESSFSIPITHIR